MLNKLKEMRESREEGFTLIELLVVIVIIGVLAAIALPIFLNQQKAAIAGGVKSDVRNTVASVATQLVKAPTSTAITLVGTFAAPGTDSVGSGSSGAIAAKRTLSDAGTTLAIGSGAVTFGAAPARAVAVAGTATWDTYKIAGSNSGTSGAYVFDSTTGKYTGQANGSTASDF